MGLPEVKFGIIPDVGGSTRLPAVVGLGRAKELDCMTGRTIDATEGERIGLLDGGIRRRKLEQATQALVDELLANSHVLAGAQRQARDVRRHAGGHGGVGAGVLRGGHARARQVEPAGTPS